MCDPNTSRAFQYGGAAYSTVGSFFASKEQQVAYRGQAATAKTNAKLEEMGAQAALQSGEKQQQAIRLRGAQTIANEETAQAGNGVDIGSKSAAEVRASSKILSEIDANTANANAVRAAWGYRMNETSSENQSIMDMATADSISPLMSGASTLMSSASSIAMSNWRYKQKTGG